MSDEILLASFTNIIVVMLKLKEKVPQEYELTLSSYLTFCDMQEYGMNIFWLDNNSDESLYFVGYNNFSNQYTGFSLQENLQLRIEEIFPNVLNYGIKQKYVNFIKNNIPSLIYTNSYSDNRINNKEFQIRLANLSNNYIGIIFQDISEQIQIKKELDKSNNNYKFLFDNIMEGVIVYEVSQDSQDFIIRNCNKSVEKIENVSKENIIGKKVSEIFPSVKDFGLFDVFQKVYRTGITEYYPLHFYKDNRIQGWRENYVYKTNTGEIIAVYRDLTQQIENEKNISFPEQNPNPVLRIGKGGKILYSNQASQPLLVSWDYKKNNTLPDYWIFIVNQVLENGNTLTEEIEIDKKIYSLTITPIEGEQYINIYGWDITKIKELEQNLAQNQKMDAMGRLAGGVAHDFNNVLTGIQGFTELLIDEPNLPIKVYDYLEQILNASRSASKITSQLLTFSRKQVHLLETIDLNSVIQSSKDFLKHIVTESITLHYNLSSDPWSILAESNQLQQILINLLLNSRDAIEKEGEIFIETHNISQGGGIDEKNMKIPSGDYVLLTISDTGKGMDKNTLSHLFEPFFTTKESGKGTGLGLSIIYSIVKQFQGYIFPYSELGMGTIFKIYFPRKIINLPIQEVIKDDLIIQKPNIYGKILIVEDDDIVRNLITQFLNDYSVLSAKNCEEAIEITQRDYKSIQLLITDIIMPKMNGKQLADKITKINSNIKVLYISGYTQELISRYVTLNENIRFLSKPFTIRQLFEKIKGLLT